MSKHTPGPWCVDGTKALGAFGVWTDYATHPGHNGAGYGSMVASVFPQNQSHVSREQRNANAHLIAAAPDLLAALERMVESCPFECDADGCECGENGTGFDEQGNPCEHIQARRAIAKAKGGGAC